MRNSISAVIITKNESHNIKRCIESLLPVCDEVVIMDSYSDDDTVKIATELGAKVFQTKWLGYAETKNLANSKTTFDYILSIDADEVLSPELSSSLKEILETGISGTYSMNRLTNYCGSWIKHSGWYPDEKIRLFDKRQVKWIGDFVHEELAIPKDISNQRLTGDLFHFSYTSQEDHRDRADKYSRLTAQKMFANGSKAGWAKPYLSGMTRFLKMYFLEKGFLDGPAGFTIARISAASNIYKYKELRRLHKQESLAPRLRHICISRTDSIGDVMLTLPLASALKQQYPSSKISFLGKNYTRALIDGNLNIDEFYSYDDWKNSDTPLKTLISEAHIDAVIHVLPSKEIATEFSAAKTPIRVGSARKLFNISLCNRLTNFSRKNSFLHESQLNLKMIEPLHCNAVYSKNEIQDMYGLEVPNSVPPEVSAAFNDKSRVILHPKSQGSAPGWSIKNFKVLAERLILADVQVLISGTQSEGDLFRSEFDWSSDLIDLTGKSSLGEFISIIENCHGLVAASTGPIHISAALGVPSVGLYFNERPMFAQRWGPIGKKAMAIEGGLENGELHISVDAVYDELIQLLGLGSTQK